MLQFKRLANVYFLIISILMSIPAISPINPLTAWAPLIIVIGISMIREGASSIIQVTRTTSATLQTRGSTTKKPLLCSAKATALQLSGAKYGSEMSVLSKTNKCFPQTFYSSPLPMRAGLPTLKLPP